VNRLRLLIALQSGFVVWVILGAFWGWLNPEQAGAGKAWITEALMLIMLGMGLTLRPADVAALKHAGKPVLLGVFLQYAIMPLTAWLLVILLGLPKMLALGVILVGCCPGGTASNVVSWLARGDVALSVAMTTVSTLLAPLLTPFWIWLMASAWLPVDPVALFGSVVQIVLLPVGLGILIRRFWQPPDWFIDGVLPLLAMVAIAWIVGVVVGLNASGMSEMLAALVIAVILLNVIGLFIGGGIASLLGLSRRRSRTVAIEVGMQNSGLAVALALAWFSPEAALAGAMFSLWHNISGALLAAFWRKSVSASQTGTS